MFDQPLKYVEIRREGGWYKLRLHYASPEELAAMEARRAPLHEKIDFFSRDHDSFFLTLRGARRRAKRIVRSTLQDRAERARGVIERIEVPDE